MFYIRTHVPVNPNCIVKRWLGLLCRPFGIANQKLGAYLKRVSLLAAVLVAAAITTAAAFGAAGTTQGGLPTIDVAMDGSSITVSGNEVSGAVNIHSTSTGKTPGQPLFVRLNPGVTAGQLIAFLGTKKAADPNNVEPYGAIVLDPGPDTHDLQTVLQLGDYVAFDSASNDPTKWPYTTFTISESGSGKLPAAQQWQKSAEFRFYGPSTLHNGEVIRASNAGFLVHMMIGFQVKNKAVGHHLMKLLREGKDSQVEKLSGPGFFMAFGPVSHGVVQQYVFNAKPGWYIEACFMDTQDGREHTQLGMERLVHVVS